VHCNTETGSVQSFSPSYKQHERAANYGSVRDLQGASPGQGRGRRASFLRGGRGSLFNALRAISKSGNTFSRAFRMIFRQTVDVTGTVEHSLAFHLNMTRIVLTEALKTPPPVVFLALELNWRDIVLLRTAQFSSKTRRHLMRRPAEPQHGS
jgi:hypothetical protein